MTTAQPRADQEDSLTAHAFAKQSGLAPELVTLFIPTTETSTGATYSRDHLPLARVVNGRQWRPPMTIRAAVRDLADHTSMEIESLGAPTSQWRHARRRRRRNTLLAIGFALVVGAGVGAAVHYASTAAPSSTTVVQTLTVSAPPGQLTPTIAS